MANQETIRQYKITINYPNNPTGFYSELYMFGVPSVIGKELIDFQNGDSALTGSTHSDKATSDTITIAKGLGMGSVVIAKCFA